VPPKSLRVKSLLFIVATPIGNLDDISKRALDALASSELILCEDTRRSTILLDRYGIKRPLLSYHKFKEKESLEKILTDLRAGRVLSLISDAGTPCINDPGQILVQSCIKEGLAVSVIPGPCSVIQALVMSGFSTTQFQFIGFLPKNPKDALRHAMGYPGTTIAFESPERLIHTLEEIDPERNVAVVREMTKKFEECRSGKAADVLAHFQKHPPKGEIVLVIEGGKLFDDLSLEELVTLLQEYHGLTLKEAIKQSAKFKDIPKRDVYNKFHKP
jgi:16S rRNA (cytidine1402-2'-O)-methyltransferase